MNHNITFDLFKLMEAEQNLLDGKLCNELEIYLYII